MNGLRRLAFPLGLARSRLGSGGERLALVAVGIVAGSAAIAAVLGGRLVIQDRAVAQATAALAPADRSLEVAWFGAFGGTWRSLDRAVAPALVASTGREPVAGDALSRVADRRPPRQSAGRDRLGRYVHLLSGRLPRRCVPSHCEVLRIAGPGPIPSKPTLRLIQVGRARLDPDAPFAPFIQPQTTPFVARALQYHTPQPSPCCSRTVSTASRAPRSCRRSSAPTRGSSRSSRATSTPGRWLRTPTASRISGPSWRPAPTGSR